nr:MAG TPA: hypothetical protein [Caudoviricetes sp.]
MTYPPQKFLIWMILCYCFLHDCQIGTAKLFSSIGLKENSTKI